MQNVADTISFVMAWHGTQKYGDCPYIVHLLLVARHFDTDIGIKTALLHDILEDTSLTETDLRKTFRDEIVDAVVALTCQPDEKYLSEYIPRVAKNRLAKMVKLADLEENLFSAKNFYFGQYDELIERYETALGMLTE